MRREARLEQPVEQPFALVQGKRVRFAGRSEGSETVAALIEQRPAEADEAGGIGVQVPIERSEHRREDALHGRTLPPGQLRWIGSIHFTSSGGSTGAMSRFTTTGSCPERITTHSSGCSRLALISWCGTYGGT